MAIAAGSASATMVDASDRARDLATTVEARATRTDFAALERFGVAAQKMPGREGLNRLYHVAWLFQTQSETEKSRLWNERLAAAAARENDRRYMVVARINTLAARYTQGDATVIPELTRIHESEVDWFTRAHAARLLALTLIDDSRTGQALRLLADAESEIPLSGPQVDTAHAGVWEIVGLGLMQLHDYEGSAAAFHRFEVEFANPQYPRPDFDSVYNLAKLASQGGDFATADRLLAAHHRLSVRSGLDSLVLWDAGLCARIASDKADPGAVLKCLEPVSTTLQRATAREIGLLAMRADALAQTGDSRAARRDLEVAKRLSASSAENPERQLNLSRVEASVLFAEGHSQQAYARLRDYGQHERILSVQRFGSGMHEVTGNLEAQLASRRAALVSATELAAANARMLGFGRWVTFLVVILLATLLSALIWQLRQGRRLKRATRIADEANRSKTDFLANMSHEIRTPLNGVIGINAALARTKLTDEQAGMVKLIATSGETLEILLTDVLDLARIESGQVDLKSESFDFEDCLHNVVALFEPAAREKGLDFNLMIEPAATGVVVGDVVRVRQVVCNLLSNAVKFTGEGHVELKAGRLTDGRLFVTVTDTGIGFDAGVKARLFQRFEQADGSITRQFGGTGLGLAISRTLAMAMNGSLDVESEPGRGSCFTFTLDLARVGDAVATASETVVAVPALTSSEQARSPRVLLAEDHPVNRKVVELLFDGTGVDLVCVENGAEAVALAEIETFDLILMDMQMPVMDGLTAIRAIRAREALTGACRTLINTLSANAMPEHAGQAIAAGADGHLTKPIAAEQLYEALARALAVQHDRQRAENDAGGTDLDIKQSQVDRVA
ncbi:ATP-binding protein [uncultured Brevundimonas sp.]|uniref:ATP-binding protein n=1 Tax=uncultured Brevundimonas sp. TaxID=213418 RepID=UPI0030EB7C1C